MTSPGKIKTHQHIKETKRGSKQPQKSRTRSSRTQAIGGRRVTAPVRGRPAKRRPVRLAISLVLLLGGVGAGLTLVLLDRGPPLGPEGIPLELGSALALPSPAATGRTVSGIQCTAGEQVSYHVHTHLSVYVDGILRPLPSGVGIVSPVAVPTTHGPFYEATRCYYWLHVHAQDGIIHIESPSVRTYTLGQFFDIWRQPLSANQIGPIKGKVTIYVNGSRYAGDPAGIVLRSHEDAPDRRAWGGRPHPESHHTSRHGPPRMADPLRVWTGKCAASHMTATCAMTIEGLDGG